MLSWDQWYNLVYFLCFFKVSVLTRSGPTCWSQKSSFKSTWKVGWWTYDFFFDILLHLLDLFLTVKSNVFRSKFNSISTLTNYGIIYQSKTLKRVNCDASPLQHIKSFFLSRRRRHILRRRLTVLWPYIPWKWRNFYGCPIYLAYTNHTSPSNHHICTIHTPCVTTTQHTYTYKSALIWPLYENFREP